MTTDLPAIRAAAEKATPGPWTLVEGFHYSVPRSADGAPIYSGYVSIETADARFIALANPATVLAMVRVVEAAMAYHAESDGPTEETWNKLGEALRGLE